MSKKILLVYILLTSATAFSADTNSNNCASLLKRITTRIFLRPIDSTETEPITDSSGFLIQTTPEDKRVFRHPIKTVTQFIPRQVSKKRLGKEHDVQILGGINEKVKSYTAKRGKRKQMTMFSSLLVGVVINTPLVPLEIPVIDYATDKVTEAYTFAKINYQWDEWGDYVKYDYRNLPLEKALKKAQLTHYQARLTSFDGRKAYPDLIKFIEEAPKDFDSKKTVYEHSIYFSHVENLKKYKEGKAPEFLSTKPAPMSDREEAKIFKLDEDLYINYEVVSVWANAGASQNLSQFSPHLAKRLREILNYPFEQKLLKLRDEGKITNLQVQFLIQQDLSDRQTIAIYNLLKIIPINKATGDLNLFTLEDLQEETLSGISTGRSLP